MSMKKRRLQRDTNAVSEIIGTIMILAITVVLFSSILVSVNMLETPESRTYIDMEASFVRETHNLTLTHRGGRTLNKLNTAFVLVALSGGVYHSQRYEHNDAVVVEFPDKWGIGEKVVLNLESLVQNAPWDTVETAEIMIMDTGRSDLLWRTVIRFGEPHVELVIKDAGVEYPQGWDNHVEAGGRVSFYARIGPSDLLTMTDVTIDLSSLEGYDGKYNMTRSSGDKFIYPPTGRIDISTDQENGTYLLKVEAESGNLSDSSYISINIGPRSDLQELPDISVDANKISFNPETPLNGASVTIQSVIENRGGSAAMCKVEIWDQNKTVLNQSFESGTLLAAVWVGIAAGGGRDIRVTTNIQVSGNHRITVRVPLENITRSDNVTFAEDSNPNNNMANTTLHVMPTILLVDDDKIQNGDASVMRGDLEGAGFTFDYVEVTGTNGPPFSDGRHSLNRYDIVIWMTCRQTVNTLTPTDQSNLIKFLEDGRSLWLLGEGFASELGAGNNLLSNYLGILAVNGVSNAPVGNVVGLDTPLDANDTYQRADGVYNGDHLTAQGDAYTSAEDDNGSVAVSYESAAHGYRVMSNSYLFRSMQSNRSVMVYRVINWVGDIDFRGGNDIAVAEQEFSTRAPMYNEWVKITAMIRNNGQELLTNVDVRLQVNGEILDNNATTINLDGMGGTERVEFYWRAEPVGEHEVLVIADPFDMITETNEENNDIRYQDVNTTVMVRFSVLVVDDDHSGDSSADVVESLERLGYAYEVFDVPDGITNGPDEEEMSLYNSVYWICGGSASTLRAADIDNITAYLDGNTGTSLFLMGDHILEDLTTAGAPVGSDAFITGVLGIDTANVYETAAPSYLYGVYDDPIGHGLAYDLSATGNFYTFDDADHVYLVDDNRNNVGARNIYGDSRVAFMTLDIAHLDGPIYGDEWYEDFEEDINTSAEAVRQELVYMFTKWFGNVDDRTELRVSAVDMEFENTKPMLGRSYLVTATIYNVGFKESNALVRFKDGQSLIASESIYVPGNGVSTAEITWQPLFAGSSRPIRVLVDPLCNVQEIGNETAGIDHMGFNNHAMVRLPVFFFWDDMQNGTDNWRTDATIANINGEWPLEFLSEEYETVDTGVEYRWDWDMSVNLENTTLYSYSDPTSFWLNETKAEEEGASVGGGDSLNSEAPPKPMATETRYMRADNVLGTVQSATDMQDTVQEGGGHNQPSTWGIRVWAGGNEITGGTPEATVTRNAAGSGIQSAAWNCPETAILDTDTVTVRVYVQVGGGAVTQQAEFTTEPLGATLLDAATWTVYYHTGLANAGGGPVSRTDATFYWGSNTYNSRIEDFTYSEDVTYTLITDSTAGGSVTDPGEGTFTYDEGTVVDLVADPDIDYYFVEWTGDTADIADTTAATTTITMNGDYTITANFDTDVTYDLTIGSTAGGSVTIPGEGTFTYDSGTTVNLEALADVNYYFVEWTGDIATIDNPNSRTTTIAMNGDYSITANFEEIVTFELMIDSTAGGSVIDPGEGTFTYDAGTVVNLEAVAEVDYSFTEWTGDIGTIVDPNSATTTIEMNNNYSITANFVKSYDVDVRAPADAVETEYGTYTYTFTVENTGAEDDNYDLTVTSSNEPDFTAAVTTPISVNAGTSTNVNVQVSIDGATNGDSATITLTAEGNVIDSDSMQVTYDETAGDLLPVYGPNSNKTAVTPAFNLTGYEEARLTFWHRYKMQPGNGGFIQIGYSNSSSGQFEWVYAIPSQSTYTGELDSNYTRLDDHGNHMDYAWNGISGGGSFGWDLVRVNVFRYVPEDHRDEVRIKFNYTQYGKGTGVGWFFDDVKVIVSRGEMAFNGNLHDQWRFVNTTDIDGDQTQAWWNADDTGHFSALGIDNSLSTVSIDLTSAREATLGADFKFNINSADGKPPDGFRVEVTIDGGRTWMPLNLGVRTASNVSGSAATNYWVKAEDLDRLQVDLSDFSGYVIRIRFRVFTCSAPSYDHYEDIDQDGGFYVNNVIVEGRSVAEG